MDFLEADPTFYNFPEAQASGYGPPKPPEINSPCAYIQSPKPKFNFGTNMATNQPWPVVDVIFVPSAQHPLPKHP